MFSVRNHCHVYTLRRLAQRGRTDQTRRGDWAGPTAARDPPSRVNQGRCKGTMSQGEFAEHPSLEEQVSLLKAQLAQAQKLTALGELVSTTTHEFNNVLMT